MAQAVEHDLVSPTELSATKLAVQVTVTWSSIPVDATDNTVTCII